MSNNINTKTINSTILQNKIAALSLRLKDISQSGEAQTKEALISEATEFLSTFFSSLNKPIFNPPVFLAGQPPSRDTYNKEFTSILLDLNILFPELDNLARIILSNFDFVTTNSNRLIGRLKNISSKVEDYILFTNDVNRDVLYFSDSFNNLNRIDFNSNLVNTKQAQVDQAQGIVTLPIDKILSIQINELPTLNDNSNGIAGNNVEFSTPMNTDLMAMLDNNSDTWFEYERVESTNSTEPLVLDLTLNLSAIHVVNYLRINPNNFGVKIPVIIDNIETSIDGKTYVSIKDDVPNGNFILSSNSSKFVGQGIFSFTPRKAKYVHIVLKQFTPYTILDKSSNTKKLRYAIGIRDLEISSIQYLAQGELISNKYRSTEDDPIRKVALSSNQTPDSELATINHFVSIDNGSTWNQLVANSIEAINEISPVLNFNTSDIGAISTTLPATTFRYKALLQRNTTGFSTLSSALKQKVLPKVELHPVPDSAPFTILLDSIPIQNTLSLVDPLFGSRGINESRFIIGTGTGDTLAMYLPFQNIHKDAYKLDVDDGYRLVHNTPEEVRVSGELWSPHLLNSALYTDRVYEIDYVTGIIKTGNGTNGAAIPPGAIVDIKFKPERLFPEQITHSAKLDFFTTHDNKTLTIKRYDPPIHSVEVLHKASNTHQLEFVPYITFDTNVFFSDTTVFATSQTFIDGDSELNSPGDYSIDTTNGVVYSYTETNLSTSTTCSYYYQPVHILDETEWDFGEVSDLDHSVVITEKGWKTNLVEDEFVPDTRRYVATANLSIVKGSLRFSDTTTFKTEVDFIDGIKEFGTAIQVTEKILVSSLITALAPGYGYQFRLPIIPTGYNIDFSNKTIFNTKVSILGDLDADGKYIVFDTPNLVGVYMSTPPTVDDLGTVSYYYFNYNKNGASQYSVNYATGEIYTADLINSGVTMSYQYTDYRASYYIARKVEKENFTFNSSDNTVTVSPREILNRQRLSNSTQASLYHIAFDSIVENRVSISELEPYFSPVLKDYAVKIVTESVLKS